MRHRCRMALKHPLRGFRLDQLGTRTIARAEPAQGSTGHKGNPMQLRNALLASATAIAAFVLGTSFDPASAQSAAALTGQVSSAEEGAMEGVVVSAKKDGSTIAISVVTDAQGRFAFPAARLELGHYTLKARATGYELPGANAADVASGQEAKAELKLRKVRNLAATLTNAEWLASMPGTDDQKKFLLNCTSCHTL